MATSSVPRPPLGDRIRFAPIARLEPGEFDIFASGDVGSFLLVCNLPETDARVLAQRLNSALGQEG